MNTTEEKLTEAIFSLILQSDGRLTWLVAVYRVRLHFASWENAKTLAKDYDTVQRAYPLSGMEKLAALGARDVLIILTLYGLPR